MNNLNLKVYYQNYYDNKNKKKDLYEILSIDDLMIYDFWTIKMFDFEITNKCALCYKYVFKNQIIAYIICHFIIDEIYILKLMVHPLFRKQQIASSLINFIKKMILNINDSKIYLEVRSKNKIAINFYEKNNFKKLYFRKKYYTIPNDDAVIMCFLRKEQ